MAKSDFTNYLSKLIKDSIELMSYLAQKNYCCLDKFQF